MARKLAKDRSLSTNCFFQYFHNLTLLAVAIQSVASQHQHQQHQAQPFQFGILQTSSQALLKHQQQQYNSNQHLLRSNINNNNEALVNTNNLLQNVPLPLARSHYQASDLDNVIESTTSTTSQQPIFTTRTHYSAACQLPPTWAGRWYQANGRESIRVTNTEISDKGVCRDQKGDKYLFEMPAQQQQQQQSLSLSAPAGNKPNAGRCLVCLVINERHLNVLQYKESSCQPIPANYNSAFGLTTNSAASVAASNNITDHSDHSLLDSICNEITGDAQLESLFRLDTPSIECPISGKYSFTYDTCQESQSSLDSCIDKKQLNFKYSACPDVAGSESKSEVLKCYADWSEGNNYYMIGRLEHASNHQDKGKFRCFVYEKSLDGRFIQMAQSLEESCNGLINANEGPKTLRLAAKPPSTHKCHFPAYIQSQSESWMSVDNSLIYMFDSNSTRYQVKEIREGNVIEEATCLQQFVYPAINPLQQQQQQQHAKSSSNNQQQQQQQVVKRFPSQAAQQHTYPPPQAAESEPATRFTSAASINDIVYLVQITKNCQTTNWCVRFYRRSNGIVQIDYFESTPNSDNQCRNAFVGAPRTQIITSTNLEHQKCPFEGAYTIEAPLENDFTYNPSNIFMCPRQSFLTAQCDHASKLRIHYRCSPAKSMTKNLYCLGSWTTDGFVRVLLADDERHRYSAWFRDYSSISGATLDLTSNDPLTRSQQLISLANNQRGQQVNQIPDTFPSIVDLRIASITPSAVASKPMQVRLTRRSQCSDLRTYLSSGVLGSQSTPSSSLSSSSLMASYAPSATASSASSATIVISQHPILSLVLIGSLLTSLIVISFSLTRSAVNNCNRGNRSPPFSQHTNPHPHLHHHHLSSTCQPQPIFAH